MSWALSKLLHTGEIEIEKIEGVISCQAAVRKTPTDKYHKFVVKVDKTTRDVNKTKDDLYEECNDVVIKKDDEDGEEVLFSVYLTNIDSHLKYDYEIKVGDEPNESLENY